MKIIDIFNKIANGEEVKFKTIDEQLEYYCKKDDFLRDRNNQEVDWWLDCLWLNKEVEIIEEDKKIKPIEWNEIENLWDRLDLVKDKINEIIKVINGRD